MIEKLRTRSNGTFANLEATSSSCADDEADVDVDAVTHCMADVAMALVDDDARRSSPALSRRLSAISGRVGDWRREAREETLLTECAVSEKRVDGWFMEQQRWFITEV